ncbi:Nucleolar, Nop52 [Sesbania bispinosa]|nr:Nucleolar, Nop52 [Sesbania bispinosa]
MADNESAVGHSLIKTLACCNKSTREKALRLLIKTWLPSQSHELPDDESKKLWKGLFYCVWHSDKPLVQSDLIDRISSVLLTVDLSLSLQYFSTFFLTMRREWSGIDALRLDKFYLLIRRFISKSFSLLNKNSWDLELVQRLMSLLDEGTFTAQDKFQGNGVNYHVASVFLEELRPFLPLKSQVIEVVLKPFFSAMGKLPDKVLLGKIKSGVFDVLLKMGKRLLEVKKAGDEVGSGDDFVVLGTIALMMDFSSRFYELGSSTECIQGNRKVLFDLHREFLKLEKDAAASGFEFSIPDVVDKDEEEVPDLVPISNGVEVDAPPQPAEVEANAGEDGGSLNVERVNEESMISLNETVISNLQKQFEKVAAEAGLEDGVTGTTVAKSGEKSTKKVRFSMKNNLVWKPHSPLPPQSLRLPPSATPRGSALKKGVPPGPIREMLPQTKKAKLKKARKAIKGVAPSVKRLKKLKSRSP